MLQESRDLIAEVEELRTFLQMLTRNDWGRPTAFQRWTAWDVVAHLHFYDCVGLLSLKGGEAFAARRDALVRAFAGGVRNAELARRELGELAPDVLLERWTRTARDLAQQLGASDPKRRLPWFGPDMGVRMFTTARLMETWAHGQEIYDRMGVERAPTDRLRHVATLGVKTFAWSFVNRGLEPPGPAPAVRLTAPSGAIWEWNETSPGGFVRGEAVDFCHVVTQGRNVADTRLEVGGDGAARWMEIAQCFAGPPVDPPKPGERRLAGPRGPGGPDAQRGGNGRSVPSP